MNDKILEHINLIYKVMNDLHCKTDEETQDEMFFEGLMGLINGIKTFTPDKNTKESTYYYVCIRNSITFKFMYNSRHIRNNKGDISLDKPIFETLKIEDIIASDIDLEKDIIQKEKLDLIYKVIDKAKNTRFKTYLCEYYGINQPSLKIKEIALKHHVQTSNVSQSIRQGLKVIRKKVKKEYEKENKKNNSTTKNKMEK